MGAARFEQLLLRLRYGTIAVNAWTGLGFLLSPCPWGGFPGADLADPQSGIGTVHNSYMLEGTERTVITAPWRPFPRGLLSLRFSLLPRPPWFITHRRRHVLGRLLTAFEYRPRIFLNALAADNGMSRCYGHFCTQASRLTENLTPFATATMFCSVSSASLRSLRAMGAAALAASAMNCMCSSILMG